MKNRAGSCFAQDPTKSHQQSWGFAPSRPVPSSAQWITVPGLNWWFHSRLPYGHIFSQPIEKKKMFLSAQAHCECPGGGLHILEDVGEPSQSWQPHLPLGPAAPCKRWQGRSLYCKSLAIKWFWKDTDWQEEITGNLCAATNYWQKETVGKNRAER